MLIRSETAATYVAALILILLAADPALAQFSAGGAAPEFQKGLSSLLWWVFVAGVFIAIVSFIAACIFLFMRNLMGFAGGVLGVAIGGALMAKAPTVVNGLTGLQSIF
jgi:type IV secretion system protein TrbC